MSYLYELSPGVKLGRYELIERLRLDGYVTSWLAQDPELNRRVAIKVATADINLIKEAKILADLPHPSILSVFDVGHTSDLVYVVHEFMPGSVDRELELQSAVLPTERVAGIVEGVASALDFVHRRGYIHRNVKPTVILLDQNGQPRLSGFEVAMQQTEPDPPMGGTPWYMAPEQWRRESLGPYTDIWELGVTFYELLTRTHPFHNDKNGIRNALSGLVHAVVNYSPKTPTAVAPSVPAALGDICMKCLAKNPAERYRDASQLAVDLSNWRHGKASAGRQRVFVSHASKDREFVEREIIATLEKNGISTWYSKVDIQTAAEWGRSIVQGLESTDWFLLVMSPRSLDSGWVSDELFWAIENRPQRLVPVLIDECNPREFHIRIARIQHIDFRHNLEDARQRLVSLFDVA